MKRHAEIAGAGFAGLTAACALAQRGWSVRVHERGQRLRTTGASADGELVLADGRKLKADLVIGADGSNSAVRDAVGLLAKRKYLVDGATRLLIAKTEPERLAAADGATTVEYWSGTRRVLYTPCSERDIYIALTMLDRDETAKATPVRKDAWKGWFPHLEPLIDRIGEQGRYDRFDLIKLSRWSAGRVAIVGDAAHALPPNIGQGGGCAMMNALSLAVHLDCESDVPAALAAWEREERPITDHTQKISVLLGLPTTWPPPLRAVTLALAGRSKWLTRQRTRTALHRPTGT